MPDTVKPSWPPSGDLGAVENQELSDQQLANYATYSQYSQQYNLYNSPYYRFPYASTLYSQNYPNFDYTNAYPAAAAYGMPYYNKVNAAAAAVAASSPISTFQQYTNSFVNAGNFNAMAAATAAISQSPNPLHSGYGGNVTVKTERPKKAKRKKPGNSQPKAEAAYKRVYVWELDDLFQSPFYGITQQHLVTQVFHQELGTLLQQILTVCFQLTGNEEIDHTNIEDANADEEAANQAAEFPNQNLTAYSNNASLFADSIPTEDKAEAVEPNPAATATMNIAADNVKRIAARQQLIRNVYERNQADIIGLIQNYGFEAEIPMLLETLRQHSTIRQHTTMRQFDSYGQCLKLIRDRSTEGAQLTNVVLSQETIPGAFARLLVCGAAPFVPPENVYSFARNDKSNAVERILSRFKREKVFIITSNLDTVQLGKRLDLTVWQIHSPNDVAALYHALDGILC